MINPVLVEVLRGGFVESRHRGAVEVCDADGNSVLSVGDVGRPVFPRSAIKLIQALPLMESGAATAYGFDEEQLALACASHNGEVHHVETAQAMLHAAGLDEDALECGPQMPRREVDAAFLHRTGERPRRIHNNCSGKHSGMLAFARHAGFRTAGYVRAEHEVQKACAHALEQVTGTPLATAPCGTDGCSIPTHAVPLRNLARGFARIGTQHGFAPQRADACRQLMAACFAAPFMVAGTGRFCTDIMTLLPGRAFVKTGAEGVFCAAFPQLGLGVALKCDDGATRASEIMMAALIARFVAMDRKEEQALASFLHVPLMNWAGDAVGALRAAEHLSAMPQM